MNTRKHAGPSVRIIVTVLLALVPDTTSSYTHSNPNLRPYTEWTLISETTTATVYNAVKSQCDDSPLITASQYHINPDTIEKDRILDMERTMMWEYGIHYGDIVKIEGTGTYDGLWQVQDTMNKRFAGQHRIDLLVPSHIRTGKWTRVKIYKKTQTIFD